ncbi:integrase [Bifidobacterium thermophilum]|uniref:Integrase n=1 Tax=Bifidobacterium thermophilum TaxID=33905 RepID=A0A2N3QPD5_9BIFI|nr:integrase [Bifidobacterium thermophilum]
MSSCSRLTASERVMIDRLRFLEHRSIRQIAAVIGHSPSTVSRELRRNLWNPSNENESYLPYRPARLKTGVWAGGPYYCAPAAHRLAGKWRERCVHRRRTHKGWRGRRISIPPRWNRAASSCTGSRTL